MILTQNNAGDDKHFFVSTVVTKNSALTIVTIVKTDW